MTSTPQVSVGLGGLELVEALEAARAADEEGLDAVWLSDHLMAPMATSSTFPYGSGGLRFDGTMPFPDTWVVVGYLAAATSSVRIGSGVFVAPLRHPFVLARAAATAQIASGNRIVVGVGAGWLEEEFEAVGVDFATRGQRLDETVDACRALWSGDAVSRDGDQVAFPPVRLVPAPDVPPPVVIGGHSPAALRRAALADGWYAPATSVREAVEARDRIESIRREHGRTGPFEYVLRPPAPVDACAVRALRAEGFEHLSAPVSTVLKRERNIAAAVRELAERLRGG